MQTGFLGVIMGRQTKNFVEEKYLILYCFGWVGVRISDSDNGPGKPVLLEINLFIFRHNTTNKLQNIITTALFLLSTV